MSMWTIISLVGLVLLIVGAALKPRDAFVKWSRLWGFSAGSTMLGKAVYMVGVVALAVGLYQCVSDAFTISDPDPFGSGAKDMGE